MKNLIQLSLLTLVFTFPNILASAQEQDHKTGFEFIIASEAHNKAQEYYDNEEPDYKSAILELEKINENDTGYFDAQYDIAYLHMLDSNYEATLMVCDKNLERENPKIKDFINLKGLALKEMDQHQDAIDLYEHAIENYKVDFYLYNNLAYAYKELGRYQDSYDTYKEAIRLNPYNREAYRIMGYLLAHSEQTTAASLCYHMNLLIKPSSSRSESIIFYLEDLMKGSVTLIDSINVVDKEIPSYFRDIDIMLDNRLALNDDYKGQSALNYNIIKCTQLLCEKMEDPGNDTTFWNRFLVRNFYDIWKEDIFEGYSYYFFQSLTNTSLKKQIEKRSGAIEKFANWASNSIVKNLVIDKREPQDGFRATQMRFYDNRHLYGKGPVSDDLERLYSPWEYFHENGVLMSRGSYDEKSNRTGLWEWWSESGERSETANFEAGEMRGEYRKFNELGNMTQKYSYDKDGNIAGPVLLYYVNGVKSDSMIWADGQRHGANIKYYLNGNESYRMNYSEGKLDGEFLSFYSNGNKDEICTYDDGKLTGTYTSYHRNGQLSSKGEMEDGEKTGPWKFYYSNGQVSTEATYKDGSQIGEVKEYFRNGELEMIKTLDESGKEDGEVIRYNADGVHYESYEYDGGIVAAIRSYDKDGNMTHEFTREKKVLEFEGYTSIGTKYVDGNFDKNGRTGHWIYYDPSGAKEQEMNYDEEGELTGEFIDYHHNESIYELQFYKEGNLDSIFIRYHANGQLENVGYFLEDNLHGLYFEMTATGDTTSIEYYDSDDQHGRNHYYTRGSDGNKQLKHTYTYYHGSIVSVEEFDSTGKQTHRAELDNGTGKIELHFPNGKLFTTRYYENGLLQGDMLYYHGTGVVRLTAPWENGQRHGKWTWKYPNGQVETEGNYVHGSREGRWINYTEDGELDWVRTYVNGDVEGIDTSYHDDGTIAVISTRREGLRHGETRLYGPAGELYLVRDYFEGDLVAYSHYDASGNLKPMKKLPNGTGKVVTYYKNGKKAFESEYKNGTFHNEYRSFHENGNRWKYMVHDCGNIEGKRIDYYPNGSKNSEVNYVNDNKEGEGRYYYESGKLKAVANFWNDDLHGEKTFYDEQGKVTKVEIWLEGELLEVK